MQSPSHSERALLQLVSEGNEQAFSALVKQYRSNIFTTALQLLHQRQLAEEVLQDVFLKVWLQRAELREVENFPAWLHTVARNTIYTAFKRSLKDKMLPVGDAEEHLDAGYNTADPLLEKEYNTLLHTAIERLPARQQETYRLMKLQGLKRNEVAALLGVSPETVKYNLDEASKKVRAYCLAQLPLGALLLLLNIR
ncbi:RNA polymerase sigma-70 factor (ECF subfamily) [Chitinophaga dinghuensis]|uniref:RNA polymerase sigma factor n=1 Tax=Chitinophaga dinghuensis TaxID=1539050 RepID=A0A327VZQ9_9BACT|nr:sigma-70 family RNA polymerase sigma factor [Chitinophaga dinghuensis]RAJ81863.1 RNA polymerase sigma-70 factor (ECF subfamily) [Chitinophaga dinghuensis]